MRVVFDSNVLVAAYATHGLCHSLLELCLVGHTLVISEDILEELSEKLLIKIKLPSAIVKEVISFLKKNALMQEPVFVKSEVCRDPDDVKILGVALAAQCDYIVSGDQDLLILDVFNEIKILSPRQFYSYLQKETPDL